VKLSFILFKEGSSISFWTSKLTRYNNKKDRRINTACTIPLGQVPLRSTKNLLNCISLIFSFEY